MAIQNFPLPLDVSANILLGYVQDDQLSPIAALVDVKQDVVDREKIDRLVNQNLGWTKSARLNAIILDPRFYQLSAAGQSKLWKRLDPAGHEIYDAVFRERTWCGRVNCVIPEEYRQRFFEAIKDNYAQRRHWYCERFTADFFTDITDIGKILLEADCSLHAGREMVFDINAYTKPRDIRVLVASAQKMAVKSLKITGTLTDEGFEILKSSGLQIDAKGTYRPYSWHFILAAIMLTSAIVIGGFGVSIYACVYLPCSPLPAKMVGYMILGDATAIYGGFFAPFACVEAQDFLERSHSQNRIFFPAAGVN